MSEVSSGAKGSFTVDTPLEVKLKGLDSVKQTGDDAALHSIIGGIHQKKQLEQLKKASWSK